MTKKVPIYKQIEQWISETIKKGEWESNQMIPSEFEIANLFEVSRMTARHAVDNLVNRGMLYRIKGSGTYVADLRFEKQIHGLTSFSEDMVSRGMTPGSRVIDYRIMPADDKIASKLGIQVGESVHCIQRVRLADEQPMAIEITYLPLSLFPRIPRSVLSESLYNYIEKELGHSIDHSMQYIEAASASEHEAKLLEIESHTPVLLIDLYSYLRNGRPFEYVRSLYRSDRYKFIQPAYRL
ncbi:MAG: GntR family transcriptional regulator [Culicoidibacterales bacterium]